MYTKETIRKLKTKMFLILDKYLRNYLIKWNVKIHLAVSRKWRKLSYKSLHGTKFRERFGNVSFYSVIISICQRENFQNFRFTREKKGTGKFDDFVFVYDSYDGKTKYSLIQLKTFE
ncbi:hypothetical protein Avbf_02979 [Armadillidium vulgare]|nr:hypothetical protein Avbf_02979 [Armadillidium vulgare]